ncbi:MAG: TonB-dependent receptor [Xanthomonadaceae bacterium]|nr:TonB-dependent receptor [Xanthomonadaceae bacterium]MDE1958790.1 TonB-dependent receptor [Xanthomonadaceae bacterium]MDE2178195.1 TonB-dependent receptor [Xanthomonadaceae bacterium]MDE2246479.1 TonB-dependent receptor [Xanthomonadaceae bacterium]
MNGKCMQRAVLSAAIISALISGAAYAQDTAPATGATAAKQTDETGKKDVKTLEQVVVTGTPVYGGVRKIDASYSITTATREQIREANPVSTADLLKIAPGLWPESTGGQTGANIEIAGFPGGGDAPFFTTEIMGSPIYGMPTLSFFETSSAFRLDDTIQRVEILQGGPSVVYGSGQIGAVANFILREGTAKPSGDIGLTYGSEGLWRLDGFYGFKVADGWYGSVGGFARTSNGVRDPQFKADQGGQLTATLSHDMDNGSMMFYARVLDDKNQFITPIPLIQNGTDQFSAYPGFDPLTSTYYSHAIQHVFLAGYPGGGTNANLANGRGAKMNFFGGNINFDFDNGISLSDKFLIDRGTMDTNALFSGSNPASLTDELYNIPTNLGGFALPPGSATATYVGGGAVDPNQSVIHQGWWFIHKYLTNVSNDFHISKELFAGNTLTAGLYLAHYTDSDKWALGNQMLMTNTPNARPITVSYVSGGNTYQLTDNQGFLDNGAYNIAENGTATNKAFYLSDVQRYGRWLFDVSGRIENENALLNVCNLQNVNLDNNPYTLYNNSVPVCNGTYSTTRYNKTHPSWTIGVNYRLADNMSVYVRANRGAHFGDFDNALRGNTTGNTPPLQKIQNFEGGFKYQSSLFYANITVYHRQFSGLPYQPTNAQGAPVGSPLLYGSDSKGINLSGAITPTRNLRLELVADYLDGHYTHYAACIPYINQVTGNGCAVINGQQLQRQPKFRYMFTPSYHIPTAWGDVMAWVTYTYVGPHTQDQSGLQQLGTYSTWDFGVVADIGRNWELRLQGTNLTNALGLTESNSRIFGAAAGSGGVILARPLQGREVNFQVKYKF